jgi:hypothetical protein
LLRAGQASSQVYGEILRSLHSTVQLLDQYNNSDTVVSSLMILLQHESGLAADSASLRQRCVYAIEAIESVVSPLHHVLSTQRLVESEKITDFRNLIPKSFFERNEANWRGRVREASAFNSYDRVRRTAAKLAEAVAADFWGVPVSSFLDDSGAPSRRSPIVQDIFNNLFALKDVPSFCGTSKRGDFAHPRDRFGKLIRNRYTTDSVQSALSEYVSACDQACQDVASLLTKLSETLYDEGHIPAVVQAAHTNLILSSAFHHSVQTNALGWNMAKAYEAALNEDDAGKFVDMWPYWIDQSEAISNSFQLSGMWLLTAPNMSGKSTLMRSTAASALLTACGLCAPLGAGSRIRRFDHLFVRGASADVPSEQKSAFGAEMGDIAALLRCCGDKSLVFVDELGRGTSPRDGTRLAGAVLETMAAVGMSGVFATHLHDILDLPLQGNDRIVTKRMAIRKPDENVTKSLNQWWTYRLEDGVCTDSMALVTAERFGLPSHIIQRAEELSQFLVDPANRSTGPDTPICSVADSNGISKLGKLPEIASLVEEVTEQQSFPVPPRWNPPASLDGKSSVYILALDVDPPQFYVGETDCFRLRIQQHRAKGGMWSNLSAIVLTAPGGKSQARAWESQIIQNLAKKGVDLRSLSDGRSIRSERKL